MMMMMMIPNLPSDVFRFFGWFYSVPVLYTYFCKDDLSPPEPVGILRALSGGTALLNWFFCRRITLRHWGCWWLPAVTTIPKPVAPVVAEKHRSSQAIDIWSVGCIYVETSAEFWQTRCWRWSDWGRAFGHARGNPNAGRRLQDVARDEVALGILGHPGAF